MQGYTHNTGTIIGKGGIELFFQNWVVDSPRGVLVIAHGLGEHSGRYSNLIGALAGKGVSIYALDHRGHGKSAGKRGHIDSFMDYINDLKIFINIVRHENSHLPLILLGHSMGGAIAFKYALTHPSDISALILSSAGLVPAVEVPKALDVVARLGSKLFPSVTSSNQIDASLISHDSAYVADYTGDPLVHDKISFRWYTEMLATTRECLERAGELAMPLLVFHGTDDKIVDFSGSITTHEKASSKDKTIHLFQGLYHETMNEVEHERTKVLSVVAAWILKHLPAKGKAVKAKTAAKPAKKAPAKKKAAPKKAKPKAKPKK